MEHTARTRPDLDRLFGALASSTRREVLRHLNTAQRPVSLAELAAVLAGDSASPRVTRSVQTALYHREIPTLEASGLVTWHRDDETVTVASSDGGRVSAREFVVGDVVVSVADRPRISRGGDGDAETER